VPYEVRHWAKQFGVSNEQVRAAIEQVGPFVGAVCLHLKDRIHPDNSWYPRAELNPWTLSTAGVRCSSLWCSVTTARTPV